MRVAWMMAVLAVLSGMAWLWYLGAPLAMIAINGVALVVGLLIGRAFARVLRAGASPTVPVALAGFAIVATAIWGLRIDGVARWVAVGPLTLQPAMILLPPALIVHAHAPARWTAAGVVLAAVGIAIQPDRSMALALVISLAAIGSARRNPIGWTTLAAALVALAITLCRGDHLAPVDFVEGVLRPTTTALAWLIVPISCLPLIAPGLVAGKAAGRAFAACWSSLFVAALVANYPTPLFGSSASAVFGYLLSVAALAHSRASVSRFNS